MILTAPSFIESLINFEPLRYALIAESASVSSRRSPVPWSSSGGFPSSRTPEPFFPSGRHRRYFSLKTPKPCDQHQPIYMGVLFSIGGTFIIELLRGFYKNYKELSMTILLSMGVALSGLFIALTPEFHKLYDGAAFRIDYERRQK